MWRKLIQPEILFLAGAMQALSPYLLWNISDKADYKFEITYYPILIWLMGYASFWVGVHLIKRRMSYPPYPRVPIALTFLKSIVALLCLFCGVQLYFAARLFGGIPLLMYASGRANVEQMNLLEGSSGFGQMGLLSLTIIVLSAMIVMLMIKARQQGARVTAWLWGGLLVLAFGSTFSGKRQGLFMIAFFLVCGSIMAFGSPMAILEGLFKSAANRKTGLIIGIIVGVIGFQLLGALASLRSLGQNQHSGIEEVLAYYQYPGMNIEEQCRVAGGLGPMEFKPFGVARFLLPFKVQRSEEVFGTYPPTIEPTSPSGFYALLHWDMGPIGIVIFSLLCGIFTQRVYQYAHRDNGALLAYCLIAWALFSAGLYNHFLNLTFLPVPAGLFWFMSYALRLAERRKRAA